MKIINFGSLNIDHVYAVDHFVKPGETISALTLQLFCGGKGLNQSVALARAGAKVMHAGKIGTDGAMLSGVLSESGADITKLIVDPQQPTGHAVIQVERSGQNSIIIFGGANTAVTEAEVDGFLDGCSKGDMLLLQNETSCLAYAARRADSLGMKLALNPSPMTQELAALPELALFDYFILNEGEGFAMTGVRGAKDVCRALKTKYPRADVMLTLGGAGCMYYDGSRFLANGIYDVPVVDTTAAGDTFTGYFLAAVAEGLPMEKALELASRASSIAVGRKGAAPSIPARDEVETAQLKPVVK